jgi:flagellar assembly factor FliW
VALLETLQLGTVDYSEETIVEFAEGLPAFETQTRFVLVERTETAPILFLQSVDNAELCFLTVPVQAIQPDYELTSPIEDLRDLGVDATTRNEDVLCLAILTARPDRPPTANLMAPVLIHRHTRRGRQVIQNDSPYSFEHPLGAEGATSGC